MVQFIISITILLIMFLEKVYFFNLENQYAKSALGLLELVLFTAVFIWGIFSFFNERKPRKYLPKPKDKNKFTFLTLIFLTGTVLSVIFSFLLNFSKTSVNWDAIALYDARAKFLAGGMKFSQMTTLAKFDNLNKYYYLLYPPYTSITHYFWENSTFFANAPVGVVYSIGLAIFVIFFFFISLDYFDATTAAILSFLIASNNSIFNIAIKEYTNMPYSLYLTVGIFLIFSYLRQEHTWKFVIGSLLVSSSIWIRFLEPIWLVVVASLLGLYFLKRRMVVALLSLGIFLLSLIEYLSWSYFVANIGKSPGFISLSLISIIQPIVGVFTGTWIVVMAFFIKSWGIPLLVSVLALISALLNWKKVREDLGILFLILVIFFGIILYFLQLYFVSFQADWWQAAAQSLDRSATFLIPISAFVLMYTVVNSKLFPSRKQDVKNFKKIKK